MFYRCFCRLAFCCFIVCFYVLLCIMHPAFASFLSSVRSTNYWVIWVNLVGWAGRGQCTDLASWPLYKMYMLLLAVSVHVYPDLMLLSCIGWPSFNAQFPLLFLSPISDCWNFYHIKETIVTPFSNLRPNSFASTIVSQSETSTYKANPELKLMFTWAKYTINDVWLEKWMIEDF